MFVKSLLHAQVSSVQVASFLPAIILRCVRWYCRYSLSYRDVEELTQEWGLRVDHSTIYHWVQAYSPQLDKRCRPHLRSPSDSWRVDEVYVNMALSRDPCKCDSFWRARPAKGRLVRSAYFPNGFTPVTPA